MQRRLIHQWRDWLLEYVDDDNYELIQRDNLSVLPIVAKNAMEAENKSQLIIKNSKEDPV
jgi:hypothetical protein